MISAIVFTPDSWPDDDLAHAREIVVRSLVWLVSAVVSSVVRDVTLAVPEGLGLAEVADQSGCMLVEADLEGERLVAAASGTKEPRLIVLKAGYQPDPGLIDEIDIFSRKHPQDKVAVLLAAPATLIEQVFPERAPAVGILLPRGLVVSPKGFDQLARSARRRGAVLVTRARPIR